MKRLFRAAKRTIRRLTRPLHLRVIDWQTKQSCSEIERLCDMRDDLPQLVESEKRYQARLEERRNRVLRGVL